MKKAITLIGPATCECCGTGYGETGPLKEYYHSDNPTAMYSCDFFLLCDECAEKNYDVKADQ